MQEALFHSVPVLSVPVYVDQVHQHRVVSTC
jgi:hypothetical protein